MPVSYGPIYKEIFPDVLSLLPASNIPNQTQILSIIYKKNQRDATWQYVY
jgi:hypothetical protein